MDGTLGDGADRTRSDTGDDRASPDSPLTDP
jgi:hypothetical protein